MDYIRSKMNESTLKMHLYTSVRGLQWNLYKDLYLGTEGVVQQLECIASITFQGWKSNQKGLRKCNQLLPHFTIIRSFEYFDIH